MLLAFFEFDFLFLRKEESGMAGIRLTLEEDLINVALERIEYIRFTVWVGGFHGVGLRIS